MRPSHVIPAWKIDAMRREDRENRREATQQARLRTEVRELCSGCHGSGCARCERRGTVRIEVR